MDHRLKTMDRASLKFAVAAVVCIASACGSKVADSVRTSARPEASESLDEVLPVVAVPTVGDRSGPASAEAVPEWSWFVAAGEFVAGPVEVFRQSEPDAGPDHVTLMWTFEIAETYRNVLDPTSEPAMQIAESGSVHILTTSYERGDANAAVVNAAERRSGSANWVASSEFAFNSFGISVPTVVYLRPGRNPPGDGGRFPGDPMVIVNGSLCFRVDAEGQACQVIAESPGGKILATRAAEPWAIAALSVTAARESAKVRAVRTLTGDPAIDGSRFTALPE